MRKIDLLVVDKDSKPVSESVLSAVIASTVELEKTGTLSEAAQKSLQDILDYQRTLLDMVKRATNPQQGMDYDEIQQIRAVYKKIKNAEPMGSVFLEEAEYAFLVGKVQAKYTVVYNEAFDDFVQSIIDAPQVEAKG